jgi:AAA ATPase-like protein
VNIAQGSGLAASPRAPRPAETHGFLEALVAFCRAVEKDSVTVGGSGMRPFVGREAELVALQRHFAAAADGAGRLVLVLGEAGIGKTRLVEHAVESFGQARVATGRCHETSGAPAYWPWTLALRPLAVAMPVDELRAALGDGAAEVARILPEVRPRLGLAEPSPQAPADQSEARFRLFDALTRFVCAAAREPLVVVLDDLHWADRESLLLLHFLGPEIRRARILILATCREAEMREAGGLPHILGDLIRLAAQLPLAGLSSAEIDAYARATAGVVAAPAVVAAIQRATAGNAFFVSEVVDLLSRDVLLGVKELRSGELQLPAGVRDAILRRVERLDADSRRLLELAALAGYEFDLAVVARAGGLERLVALERLTPALGGGILVDRGAAPGRLRFVHQLVADALSTDMRPDARRKAHLALADATLAEARPSLEEAAGEIARHLLSAAPLGDLSRAMEFASRAGDHSLRLLGYEEAAGHYRRALEAARASAATPRVRLDLLFSLTEARAAAGEDGGARDAAVEAARLARDLGDVGAFARAAALAGGARSETGQPDHEVVELLEDAARRIEPADHTVRALVLAPLSRELYFVDRARGQALSEAALGHAQQTADPMLLGSALGARHLALWEPGRAEERLAIVREQLALAERAQSFELAMHAHAWHLADLLELGHVDQADEALRGYAALAERRRLPRLAWHVGVAKASQALRLGRLDEAERLANAALASWQASPQNNVLQFFAIQLCLIREEQGRLAELDESLQAFAGSSALPAWRATVASLHVALGRAEPARAILAEIRARGFAALPRDGSWLATMARLATLCAALEARDAAAELYPLLEPLCGSNVVIGAGVACLGSAARFAGLLACTAGRLDAALRHLGDAVDANRRGRAHAQLAHAQLELAHVLRARGDESRAAPLIAEARAAAQSLGLRALAAEIDAVGGGAPRSTDAPERGAVADESRRAVLRREGDVWLVAAPGEATRVRDMKGIHYLLHLLSHPGREFHALDVVGQEPMGGEDAGELADPEARRAYRARLLELREQIEEAEEFNDAGRVEMLRDEMEALTQELSRVAGLGGRPRRAGSLSERARLNVTRAIRKLIARIEPDCPRLGRHLSNSIQTGRFCSYEEDPLLPLVWELEGAPGSP